MKCPHKNCPVPDMDFYRSGLQDHVAKFHTAPLDVSTEHEHVLICPDCDKTPHELGYVMANSQSLPSVHAELSGLANDAYLAGQTGEPFGEDDVTPYATDLEALLNTQLAEQALSLKAMHRVILENELAAERAAILVVVKAQNKYTLDEVKERNKHLDHHQQQYCLDYSKGFIEAIDTITNLIRSRDK